MKWYIIELMPHDLSGQPKTSLGQRLLLVVFGILLCFLLLEAGLRLAGFVYSAANPLPRDEGAEYRILCVGESTTFGVGASDPALFNYPRQLENMLREKFPDLKIQVFYDGKIGGNTTENLINLPSMIEKYRPQTVIFMAGLNNWWNLDRSNILIFNKNRGFSEFVLKTTVFLDRFRTYKLFKMIAFNTGLIKLNKPMPEAVRHENGMLAEDKRGTEVMLGKAIDYYFDIVKTCDPDIFTEVAFYDLREMVRTCQRQQIKVIICSYPSRDGNEALYKVQKKVSALFNCSFVDHYAVFKDLSDPASYFSYDEVHPNDKGYHLLAKNIFNCIVEGHFLETSQATKKR